MTDFHAKELFLISRVIRILLVRCYGLNAWIVPDHLGFLQTLATGFTPYLSGSLAAGSWLPTRISLPFSEGIHLAARLWHRILMSKSSSSEFCWAEEGTWEKPSSSEL